MSNSLNDIVLNNSMLAGLYERSLVEVQSKKVLVVVKSKPSEQQNSFLQQILVACKIDPANVSVMDSSDRKQILEKVVAEMNPQYILSFGTGSGTELFSMANNKGTRYLNAPALEEMMQETDSLNQYSAFSNCYE
jgi:hypothetical protein